MLSLKTSSQPVGGPWLPGARHTRPPSEAPPQIAAYEAPDQMQRIASPWPERILDCTDSKDSRADAAQEAAIEHFDAQACAKMATEGFVRKRI